MDSPLNINLIIPFKDNNDLGKNTTKRRMVDFQNEILSRVDDISDYLKSRFGSDFGLQIKRRNSRGIVGFHWRIIEKDNKSIFRRLNDDQCIDLLKTNLDREGRLEMVEIEKELLCLNANMRVSKIIEQSIDLLVQEHEVLFDIQLHNMGL